MISKLLKVLSKDCFRKNYQKENKEYTVASKKKVQRSGDSLASDRGKIILHDQVPENFWQRCVIYWVTPRFPTIYNFTSTNKKTLVSVSRIVKSISIRGLL